jgi:uncharacterized protein
VRPRLPIFVGVVQSILILTHLVLYETWIFFWGAMDPSTRVALRVAVAILSVSFVTASFLAFRYSNFLVRIFYTASALWLGFGNFFLLAACGCWVVFAVTLPFGVRVEPRAVLLALFGFAFLTGIYGAVNASWTRVKRITVTLPNLPESWRGRTAALVSDLHLGHVRNCRFVRRIVRMLARLHPDALFVTGDLFDGTAVKFARLAKPWSEFSVPLGSYFVTGNHEQFSSPAKFLEAAKLSGFRVLNNEKIVVDGLQIVGVHYRDSVNPERFRSILKQAALDHSVASVLLVHTPDRMPVAEEEGVSLQLCGHTHRGQCFPFTLIVSRVYGVYAYGLNRFRSLTVYTSCGAGTWGPPFRVGTNPEIVLIRFD